MSAPVKIMPPIDVTYAKLTSSNVAETEYGNYAAGTAYAAGDRVIVPATHDVWESLANANTGNTPASSPTWWVRVGPTNRMAMVDTSVSTQTTRAGGIDVTVTPGETIDTLALLNINAASVRVRMTDPTDGVVHDHTSDMIAPPSESEYFAWFFEPITRIDYLVATLPAYGSADVRVELIDTGTAACGVMALGLSRKIGEGTLAGARTSITDYSGKERDTWGQYQIVERGYSNRASISTVVKSNMVDPVKKLLASRRARPTLCIASDQYSSLVLFGLISFDVTIPYPTYAMCDLEIEEII
jgi:hypothetical protein